MWKNLQYYRQALGINMLWNAYPIVTVVRDGFGIGPSGSITTLLFWIVGLFLLIPVNIFQRIYAPNRVLFFFWISFATLSAIYMVYYQTPFYNYKGDFVREILNYILPTVFLFGLLFYPSDKTNFLISTTALFSLLASIGVLYIIFHDPTWNIGKRAAISFKSFGAGHEGNPHSFATNALRGFFSAIIIAYKSKRLWIKLLYTFCTLVALLVILLTRTNAAIISFIVAVLIYLVLNGRQLIIQSLKFKNLIFATIGLILLPFITSMFVDFTNMLGGVGGLVQKRLFSTIFTATGLNLGTNLNSTPTTDYSSANRISSFNYFRETFLDGSLQTVLFGEGYKSTFLDVPILEAFINEGIFGFLIFGGFVLGLFIYIVREILLFSNHWNSFLAYSSLTILLGFFTAGRPVDTGNWLVYVVLIRFLGTYSVETKLKP